MPLFILLAVVPIIEIALFIQVGGAIGLWPTLATVIGTALLGSWLLRKQGRGAMMRLQQSLSEGGDPTGPIAHGAMILVAGILLLTPGFFTDACGVLLLMPPVREALIRWGAARLAAGVRSGRVVMTSRSGGFGAGPGGADPFGPRGGAGGRPHPGARGDVIDGEYEPAEDDASDRPGERRGPPPAGGSGWTREP
ncbi:FxsA family protein [Albimonas sp. CAU 1670]|uniref:FxsA family protein n=1 Tax=Albimonas sp. CAU 1670 TaxID=3032599 RepID=UPI0023DC2D62|nr:FxsA family protein [Albimonas sp. CAU 1670]MDF2231198.1 FxsA family protein [Albimonas sp. CAU 1670]